MRSYPEHFILWQIAEIQEVKPNNPGIFKASIHNINTNTPLNKYMLNKNVAYTPTLMRGTLKSHGKALKVSYYRGEKS